MIGRGLTAWLRRRPEPSAPVPAAVEALEGRRLFAAGADTSVALPDLAAALAARLPAQAVGGDPVKGSASVRVRNEGTAAAAGPVAVSLFLSADAVYDPADAPVATSTASLKLRPGSAKVVRLKVTTLPDVAEGSYRLLARVDADDRTAEADESNNVSATGSTVTIARPLVDLVGAVRSVPRRLLAGTTGTASVLVRNAGNASLDGPVTLALFASNDPALDAELGGTTPGERFLPDRPVGTLPTELTLRPGEIKAFRFKFTVAVGLYHLVLFIDQAGQVPESAEDNNLAVSAKRASGFVDFDFWPF